MFLACGGRRVPFSCFALPDSFSTVPRASGPIFMFCVPVLVFGGGTDGVGFHFLVLRSLTPFRWYRLQPLPFSCLVLTDMFSTVWRASGPVFMFCAPELIFYCTDGVGSRFLVLRPILDFSGSEGVGSRFLFLRPRTGFWRYGGRRVLFSCFALPDLFSAVPRA
jgi:hypothetical protein